MSSLRQVSGFLFLLLFSLRAQAQNIPLQNLTADDMKNLVGDMSTNFLHTSVSGAGTLGHIFGFEVGLVGGETSTPHINNLANEVPGNTANVSKLPDAALLGVLTVPLGFTGEIGLVPKIGSSTFKFSSFSAAVKWTATELFFADLPLSLATKLSYTSTALDFNQTIQTVPTDFSYKNTETAFTLLASKNFAIVEPYVGLGYVSATGDLTASGSTTVFSSTFTASNSGSATRSGALFLLGGELKLLVVKLGLEYTNMFSTSRYMGKLSFYF